MLIVDRSYFKLELVLQKVGQNHSLELFQTHPNAQRPRRQRICQLNLTPAELEAFRNGLRTEAKTVRNPKYPWVPAYTWDSCPDCFEVFDLDHKCDNCGSGHADQFIPGS